MIGRPDWFTTKKYIGIGLRPKTWQGWAYILVILAIVLFIVWQPFWEWTSKTRNTIIITWAVIVVLDSIHITYLIYKKKK